MMRPGMTAGTETWARTARAVALLAIDPAGLGGLWLRARSGPVRDQLIAGLASLPLPPRRLHPAITDDALFGGTDLAATLSQGRIVRQQGLLATAATLILPMAERTPPGLAARLCQTLDAAHHTLIALDEGTQDEALPAGLADRLAFHIDLNDVAMGDTDPIPPPPVALNPAEVAVEDSIWSDLVQIAIRLGIDSLRAPLFALKAARANAALFGRNRVTSDDLTVACELVYAPRATHYPTSDDQPEPPPAPPEPDTNPESADADADADAPLTDPQIPQDILLEAVRALLPADLLARIAKGQAARAAKAGAGAGALKKGNRRGRPLPSRPGKIDGTARIDLVATLRAAAPWQPVRRRTAGVERILHIRPADIRTRRYQEQSDRLLVFTVDASGSAAFARLAEAKGAVELLLGQAYARRDHVALIAFRGEKSDLLLPPTRSLVQTKRRLAALPGGGGTPLASGLKMALETALLGRAKGMTPTIALLTDGRANICLDGTANRAAAARDALHMAAVLRAQGIPALVIDMGTRPEPGLKALADCLAAPYIALPRADAGRLSAAVSAALEP